MIDIGVNEEMHRGDMAFAVLSEAFLSFSERVGTVYGKVADTDSH